METLEKNIFSSHINDNFEDVALEVFRYQYQKVSIYKEFCYRLKRTPSHVRSIEQIPFLPIQFFKQGKILSTDFPEEEIIFSSSGTTGTQTSQHYVAKLRVYEKAFLQNFEDIYGKVEDFVILGLLPSYLEREGSSLIYMVDKMIQISKTKHEESGFFLHNHQDLYHLLKQLDGKKKILLIGVSFALLDFTEKYQLNLTSTTVMETGGMKGRRREMIREELHQLLSRGFGVQKIHSEYGMTELLSQAYSRGDGVFSTPNLMRLFVRDTENPLDLIGFNKNGGLNMVDLSNLYSVSFIATQDLAKKINETDFEVVGRFDNSDIRGCNLMVL